MNLPPVLTRQSGIQEIFFATHSVFSVYSLPPPITVFESQRGIMHHSKHKLENNSQTYIYAKQFFLTCKFRYYFLKFTGMNVWHGCSLRLILDSFCIHCNPLMKDYSYLSHQIHSDMWELANQTIKSNSSPWEMDWSKINWPHGCLKE